MTDRTDRTDRTPRTDQATVATGDVRLKRALGLPGLTLFGLAYLVPLTVFTTYGVVTELTGGRVALAYVFTLAAMLFTALSYGRMVEAFPVSGSAYTYTSKAFGPQAGFLSGWALMLDYVVTVAVQVAAGTAALGIFFAFWSWIGYETTAVYGEESKDPKRIVPQATLMAVIGLGVFYVLVSWLVIAGNGADQAVAVSRGSTGNSFDVFLDLTRANLGGPSEKIYEILACTGSFACAMAFHNAASRYLYAFGREGIISPLGRTHGVHKSPHVASITQSVITLAITLGFFWLQSPTETAPDVFYFYQYGLLALLGTMALLIVQTICSVAVVCYFHVGGNHPESAHWFRTLTAPVLGAIGMAYVVYLLFDNLTFAAGAASGSPVFTATPYIVLGTFVLGVAGALALRAWAPEIYERTGRVVMDDAGAR